MFPFRNKRKEFIYKVQGTIILDKRGLPTIGHLQLNFSVNDKGNRV
jgi:hypothetical protein